MTLRPLVASDAAAVAALEAVCNPQPWSAQALADFAAPDGSNFVRAGMVATDDETGAMLGYALGSLVAGEAELLLVGVHPDARRRGLARALLEALFARFKALDADSVFLEVRRGNTGAIRLYESLDFAPVGARAGYYADNGEDARLFRKEL